MCPRGLVAINLCDVAKPMVKYPCLKDVNLTEDALQNRTGTVPVCGRWESFTYHLSLAHKMLT